METFRMRYLLRWLFYVRWYVCLHDVHSASKIHLCGIVVGACRYCDTTLRMNLLEIRYIEVVQLFLSN